MQEQWIVATAVDGGHPENFVGPFPTRAAAQEWMDGNGPYLSMMAQSARDNWVGDLDAPTPPVAHHIWFVNAPQDVAHGLAQQEAEMAGTEVRS